MENGFLFCTTPFSGTEPQKQRYQQTFCMGIRQCMSGTKCKKFSFLYHADATAKAGQMLSFLIPKVVQKQWRKWKIVFSFVPVKCDK